jgi:hypothetical protein
MFALADALAYTDIVATRSAYVTGTNAINAQRLLAAYGGSPLRYRDNGRAIASTVFLWPGMVFTVVSTYLLWHSIDHIDTYGPKSTHARTRDDVATPSTEKPLENGSAAGSAIDTTTPAQPEQSHTKPEADGSAV